MKTVCITGSSGFFGQHLRRFLYAFRDSLRVIEIPRSFLNGQSSELVKSLNTCDVLVHLAGAHGANTGSEEEIFATNTRLADVVTKACDSIVRTPHIIFASSIQRGRDNAYGRSKLAVEEHFLVWGKKTGAPVSVLVIPHEFGEYGKPYQTTVVATFSHEILNGKESRVNADAEVHLIHAQDVAKSIYELMKRPVLGIHTLSGRVLEIGELHSLLRSFKRSYVDQDTVPHVTDAFEWSLFNSFRSHLANSDFYPRKLDRRSDPRGALYEIVREQSGGQVFVSNTRPGATRGEHYHARKLERFCVLHGQGTVRIRDILSDHITEYQLVGGEPAFIDMPTFYTHSITNTGTSDLTTLFWTNEIFDPNDPDTYRVNV